MQSAILKELEKQPLADTHEHLLEESDRTSPGDLWRLNDIGILFSMYADSDLYVSGMPKEELDEALLLNTPPDRKWQLIAPYWPRIRNTGYGLCILESIREMFGVDDLTDENWQDVNSKIGKQIAPGYYRNILRNANIDHCQVNALDIMPFRETEQPDILLQDISFVPLSIRPDVPLLESTSGMAVKDLDDWYKVIDWTFETYAPRAVAAKNQCAYVRPLKFEQVDKSTASSIFSKHLKDIGALSNEELRPLEDHLMHHCIDKAAEHGLPVKLHTGYLAGADGMPLRNINQHASDLSDLVRAHPKARFVLMHITYPYQDEAIALAKHYENVTIDMCWAWIINPIASIRFLREFLLAVPSNKLLTFGGDFGAIELVPGHASIARRGMAQALSSLVQEGWIRESDLPTLIKRLTFENADSLFDLEKCKAAT